MKLFSVFIFLLFLNGHVHAQSLLLTNGYHKVFINKGKHLYIHMKDSSCTTFIPKQLFENDSINNINSFIYESCDGENLLLKKRIQTDTTFKIDTVLSTDINKFTELWLDGGRVIQRIKIYKPHSTKRTYKHKFINVLKTPTAFKQYEFPVKNIGAIFFAKNDSYEVFKPTENPKPDHSKGGGVTNLGIVIVFSITDHIIREQIKNANRINEYNLGEWKLKLIPTKIIP